MQTVNFLTPVKDFMSFDPFRLFPHRMGHFEEPLFRPMGEGWAPPCDIFETDHELVMKFELPEVKKQDVELKSVHVTVREFEVLDFQTAAGSPNGSNPVLTYCQPFCILTDCTSAARCQREGSADSCF